MGDRQVVYVVLFRRLEENTFLEVLGVNGMIILKWSARRGVGSVESFDCTTEPLSSIKCAEFVKKFRKFLVRLFECLLAGRLVDQSVSLCDSQTSERKTHLTHSLSHSFHAKSQHTLTFPANHFLAIKTYIKSCTGLSRPSGFQKVPRQSSNEGSKVIRPMDLPTLPARNIPVTHFC